MVRWLKNEKSAEITFHQQDSIQHNEQTFPQPTKNLILICWLKACFGDSAMPVL